MPAIAITGASSGLGLALSRNMAVRDGWRVYNLSDHPTDKEVATYIPCDVTDYESVEDAVEWIYENDDDQQVQVLVNCAGINEIKYLEDMYPGDWEDVMDTNARSIFYTSLAFLNMLKACKGTICNITSDAAWKPMTGSLAYNASKGAAHIMTLQLARELTRRHSICVFGVAPGKMGGTGMSDYIDRRVVEMRGWTPEEAAAYAQAGRLWPEEINVDVLADFLGFILGSPLRHRYFSGCIIPYGA